MGGRTAESEKRIACGTLRALILIMVLALLGCQHYQHHPRFTPLCRIESPEFAAPKTLSVHFLGTAGLYLQADGVSVLADPFFTNPSLLRALTPVPTGSNTQTISNETARLPGIRGLQAILVSHSHYDHAMDLPYLVEKFPDARVYGSETLRNILAPLTALKYTSLEESALDPTQGYVGWISIAPRVRIAAVKAQHFSHVLDYHYASGEYAQPLQKLPTRLYQWREGETYSFVIDVLDGPARNDPLFRIFYMPSAATHPAGTPPAAILDDGKQIDLAIIGASQIEKDARYPGDLLRRINPKTVMLVHWDDFFDGYRTTEPLMNFKVDPDEIAERISTAIGTETRVYWPQRGAVLNLPMPVEECGIQTSYD